VHSECLTGEAFGSLRCDCGEQLDSALRRDTIGNLRGAGFIGSGPRSPTPGAPYNYVTTSHFLSVFGLETRRDLPNIEALEDVGLLSRAAVWEEQRSAGAKAMMNKKPVAFPASLACANHPVPMDAIWAVTSIPN